MSALMACPGRFLPSDLPVDPCGRCQRRGPDALIGPVLLPVVRWIESDQIVGYKCENYTPARARVVDVVTLLEVG